MRSFRTGRLEPSLTLSRPTDFEELFNFSRLEFRAAFALILSYIIHTTVFDTPLLCMLRFFEDHRVRHEFAFIVTPGGLFKPQTRGFIAASASTSFTEQPDAVHHHVHTDGGECGSWTIADYDGARPVSASS